MDWRNLATRRRVRPGERWLITGGSGSLGTVLAALAERDLGAEVLTVDRSPATDAPRRHLQADLGTAAGVQQVVDEIRTWRPNVLVNGAAINQSRHVADTDDEETDLQLRVNLGAPYALMREMARLAREGSDPRWVVNIVSPYRHLGVRTHSLYCATKAGLSRAGESAAVETGWRHPFTVVSVSPGTFESTFRPVEAHDAPLVRLVRRLSRSPEKVGGELLRRLTRGTRLPHRTVRLGWQGWLFDITDRTLASDWFLALQDQLIGQRELPGGSASSGYPADRQGAAAPDPDDTRSMTS